MRKPTKTNAILLAIIGVLAVVLVARSDSSSAWAQPQPPSQPTTEAPFNAAEQRRQMIAALNQINSRLGTLESKLSGPLPVKVTEMPPVVIKDSTTKK